MQSTASPVRRGRVGPARIPRASRDEACQPLFSSRSAPSFAGLVMAGGACWPHKLQPVAGAGGPVGRRRNGCQCPGQARHREQLTRRGAGHGHPKGLRSISSPAAKPPTETADHRHLGNVIGGQAQPGEQIVMGPLSRGSRTPTGEEVSMRAGNPGRKPLQFSGSADRARSSAPAGTRACRV